MNSTPHVKEPHLDPPDEGVWWCVEHGCNADDCPNGEEDCELIGMSEHHADAKADFAYDWWNDEERL